MDVRTIRMLALIERETEYEADPWPVPPEHGDERGAPDRDER